MNKYLFVAAFFVFSVFSYNLMADAGESSVPDPFQRFDAESKLVINYSDLDALLDALVLNTGRSDRQKASATQARTGTRMKADINRATVNEGNRFYYETFQNNEQNREIVRRIRSSLESIPQAMPLEKFSRDEQLAYWLNLYNVTILDELVNVYPKHDLEQLLIGEESILDKKILTVAGVPLSLNDIQFTILKNNYQGDPLVMYGLYQGNIGGPNIRKTAYTSKHVYGDLIDNAVEFINSNRGTEADSKNVFRVSGLYERNRSFFSDYDTDLREHLLRYLEGQERDALLAATEIRPDINDWTITDLFGSYRDPAGSLADNKAALMGASPGASSSKFVSNRRAIDRYSPSVMKHLEELNEKRDENKTGSVTMEELGQDASAIDASGEKDDKIE